MVVRKIVSDGVTKVKPPKIVTTDDIKENTKDNEDSVKSSWSWKNILINILKTLVVIVILPAFLNYTALIREGKELKPEGVLIDIKHGQKLFKSCMGEGTPTVIMDAPSGETSDVWSLIFPAVAEFTKVCVYDRAGLGFSDRIMKGVNETKQVGRPHTVERMVEDFHKLFETEERPLTLVGADLGATVTKFYAQMFQDDMASVVFINPIFEGIFLGGYDNPWSKYWYNSFMPTLQLQHIFAAFGITRIGLQTGILQEPMSYPETPDIVKRRQKYLKCKPGHVSSVVEENYFLNESLSQSRTLHKLRPYPNNLLTSVIWTDQYTAKVSPERNQVWLRSQEMFSKSFPNQNQITTKLKGFLPKTFFTDYKNIADVIKKSVIKWRTQSKVQSKY